MAYSDFNLKNVKSELGLSIVDNQDLFSNAKTLEISTNLQETLAEHLPLALAINTEKARSEMIVANILVEVRRLLEHKVSLFSGVEFNVDKEKNLTGFCDFIFSATPEQRLLCTPVVAIVEAKNDNIANGFGQCIAEMVAAQIFNNNEQNENIKNIYGVITTGTIWQFLKLVETTVYIDFKEYYIESLAKIMGIIAEMVTLKI